MMRLTKILLAFGLLIYGSSPACRAESAKDEAQPRAIKALLITGGCCHDYQSQKKILSEGISKRANVEWTIVHQGGTATNVKIPVYEDADWAHGYDVVVHNECFSHVTDREWVERILAPHRAGTPAVLIHCAMHCYRVPDYDQWFRFCGVRSHNHGPKHPITVKVLDQDHFITRKLPAEWTTPHGELYNIAEVYEGTHVLATGSTDKLTHPLIWTSRYGKGRVFATTLGHHNETMQQEAYLDMVTNGLLWACQATETDSP